MAANDIIRLEFDDWYENQFFAPPDLTDKLPMLMYLAYRAGFQDGEIEQQHTRHRDYVTV